MIRSAAALTLALVSLPLCAQEPSVLHVYAPGDLVRAEFSLSERTREGGRLTPFYTNYRPRISVDGGPEVSCRFVVETEGGHKPGTSGEIGMTCPIAITEGQNFIAHEGSRPIGTGVILPLVTP